MTACVSRDRYQSAPNYKFSYVGFVDPSGGSSDSMAIAIGHMDYIKETVVIDCMDERKPPFSPEQVTQEFTDLAKRYRLKALTGDRYGGLWPREQFEKFNIRYEPADKPKSDLYVSAALFMFGSHPISLTGPANSDACGHRLRVKASA